MKLFRVNFILVILASEPTLNAYQLIESISCIQHARSGFELQSISYN